LLIKHYTKYKQINSDDSNKMLYAIEYLILTILHIKNCVYVIHTAYSNNNKNIFILCMGCVISGCVELLSLNKF